MREILFRGKTTNNEWCEGAYYHQTEFYGDKCDDHYIITSCDELEDNVMLVERVIPETIGQYTGLTDKNGKKIFEGDIIKAMMDYGPAGFYERIVPIKWLDNVGYQWQYFDISTIEIIGNIHDKPELLGGDTDVRIADNNNRKICQQSKRADGNDITNNILTATAEYGVFVNKDELIKALQYDRNQYNKGYADGYSEFAFDFYKAFREHYKAYIPDGLVRMADVVELLESVKQGGERE